MPPSPCAPVRSPACSRSAESSWLGRVTSFVSTSRSGRRTWGIDGASRRRLVGGRAAGCKRPRHRQHLREPGARDRDHLPLDGRDQLRAGRDGDLLDLHRLVADRGPERAGLALRGRLRRRPRDLVRGRRPSRTRPHPASRTGSGADDRDGHAGARDRLERLDRMDLGSGDEELPRRVLDAADPRRLRHVLDPGRRLHRRHARRRPLSLPLLPLHEGGPRPAGCGGRRRGEPAAGCAGGLDARTRLGHRHHARSAVRNDDRAHRLPRSEHDARRPSLRVRGCSAGGPRQSDRSGGRRPRPRRPAQPARHLRRLLRRPDAAGGRTARDPGRPARPPPGALRPRRREAGMRRPTVQPQALGKAAAAGAFVLAVALVPLALADYQAYEFALVGAYFVAVCGLNILTGYTGQISLGHGAFMALGGYTTAILSTDHGIDPVWTIPIAGLVAGLAGFAFGIPALRLSGLYLALVTFGIAVAAPALARKLE